MISERTSIVECSTSTHRALSLPEQSSQVTWGIIRYAPCSGIAPEDDAAAFDGWYADRRDALAIANDWAARYPQWIVGLVQSDLVWFGDGDFSTVADRPLTHREAGFAARGKHLKHRVPA
jgi:hypothetical protein